VKKLDDPEKKFSRLIAPIAFAAAGADFVALTQFIGNEKIPASDLFQWFQDRN